MLHKNMIEQKSGFRTLDDVELEAVSGGTQEGGENCPDNEIVVEAPRISEDGGGSGTFILPLAFLNFDLAQTLPSPDVFGPDFDQEIIVNGETIRIMDIEEPDVPPNELEQMAQFINDNFTFENGVFVKVDEDTSIGVTENGHPGFILDF